MKSFFSCFREPWSVPAFYIIVASMLLGIPGPNALAQSCGAVPTSIGGVATPVVAGSGDLSVGNNSYIVGDAGTTNTSGNGTSLSVGAGVGPPGQTLPGFQPTTFPAVGSTNSSAATIAAGSWGKITIGSPTTFSGGTYYISEISAGNTKSINFAAGDYFIDKFSAGNDLVVTVTSGPVRLFIKTSFQAGNQSIFNSGGSPADFQVFVYDNASVQFGNSNNGNASVSFNGLIYAPGTNTSISFGNNNVIQGAVLSGGDVNVGNNTGVIFDSATQLAIAGLDSCQLVGEFRFDECSLTSGSAGAVKDSSRHARHGTPYGFNTASGKVYNGGNFSATGTADYAIFNNAIVNGLTSLTVSLWFKTSVSKTQQELIQAVNSSVADQLELYINKGNGIYVKIAGAEKTFTKSGGNVADGNWHHLMVVRDTTVATSKPNVCVYVDGAVWGACDNNSTFNKTALSVPANGFVIGQEQDAVGGTFNTGQALDGYIDELVFFASPLVAADASAIYSAQSGGTKNWSGTSRTNACSTIDHVEFVHDGSAVTCAPDAIKVLGCTTSAACNSVPANQYSGSISVTLPTISGATWCSDSACATTISGTQSITAGNSIYLKDATATTVSLAGGTATGAATSAVQCYNTATSTGPATTTAACNLAYNSAGFLVSGLADSYACTAQTVKIQAVQSNATGTACVPAFASTNRSIDLYGAYTNPTSGTKNASFNYWTSAAGATTTAVAALGTSSGTKTTLTNLYFDGTGTATLASFSYPDAGQITLFPTYTSASGTDNGVSYAVISGNSFIAAPKSFSFSAIPAAPLTAGTPFNVTVTAYNNCSTPAITPNFGQETTAQTVTLSSSNYVPAIGNATAISQTLSGFSGGVASTNLTWKEVGTFDLTATSASYLGSALSPSSTQASVGRFKPGLFKTALTNGCSTNGFTYSGQPLSVTVTAYESGGTSITANYAGATWAKVVTLSEANAIAGTLTTSGTTCTGPCIDASSFAVGAATVATPSFTFTSKTTAPTLIKLRAIDADGASSSGAIEGTTTIYSGRVRLSNANGSELLALPIPVYVEYYASAASAWQTNALDTSCTTLTAANFAFSFPSASNPTNNLYSASAGVCKTKATLSGSPPTPTVSLSAPGSGLTGWADVTLNLGASAAGNQCPTVCTTSCSAVAATTSSKPWLQFNWTGSTDNPKSRARFGVPKSGPTIHQRELF
jgi:MSHA biogenesis protein MshQ